MEEFDPAVGCRVQDNKYWNAPEQKHKKEEEAAKGQRRRTKSKAIAAEAGTTLSEAVNGGGRLGQCYMHRRSTYPELELHASTSTMVGGGLANTACVGGVSIQSWSYMHACMKLETVIISQNLGLEKR